MRAEVVSERKLAEVEENKNREREIERIIEEYWVTIFHFVLLALNSRQALNNYFQKVYLKTDWEREREGKFKVVVFVVVFVVVVVVSEDTVLIWKCLYNV